MRKSISRIYFLVYEDYFKLGISKTIKRRVMSIMKEIGDNSIEEKSFYYKINENSVNALEYNIKRKYKKHSYNIGVYETETFGIECLDNVIKDIEEYHKLFNYEVVKKKIAFDKTDNKSAPSTTKKIMKKTNEMLVNNVQWIDIAAEIGISPQSLLIWRKGKSEERLKAIDLAIESIINKKENDKND